jgi:alpha-tubulin suppressor-like RCC1 family protein
VHSCALGADGAVWCWGQSYSGQLGLGATDAGSTVPVRVQTLPLARALSVGREHTCGIALDGALHCWGLNSNGQLGDGSTQTRSSPVLVWDPY